MSKEKTARNLLIIKDYRKGSTLAEIARQHDVDRSRIKQIIKASGIDLTEGGFRVKNEKAEKALIVAQELACRKMYGVNLAEKAVLDTLLPRKKKAVSTCYVQHRFYIKSKGFKYELTYHDYVHFWLKSGEWSTTGRGKKMILKPRCRVYKADNIIINL